MYKSKNWSCKEWDCYERSENDFAADQNGSLTTSDEKTANLFMILDLLRDQNENWVINTTSRGEKSGFRDEEVNRLCGGEPNSFHLKGCAADIHISNEDLTGEELAEMVQAAANDLGFGDLIGLGVYEDWVHVDARGYSATW